MVVAYSLGPKTEAPARARLEAAARELQRCDELLRSLRDEDAAAYEQLSATGRGLRASEQTRPGDAAERDNGNLAAAEAYRTAAATAAAVPLEMAAVASTARNTLDGVKQDTNRRLTSDAAVSAILLDACARAAPCSVRVNLAQLERGQSREEIGGSLDEILTHCAERAAGIETWPGRE